jgi:hypothetical protein
LRWIGIKNYPRTNGTAIPRRISTGNGREI